MPRTLRVITTVPELNRMLTLEPGNGPLADIDLDDIDTIEESITSVRERIAARGPLYCAGGIVVWLEPGQLVAVVEANA